MDLIGWSDKTKRVDTILLAVSTFFLLASGILILDDRYLFQNIMASKQKSQQNPVATLKDPQNDVRKKLPGDLVWIPVSGVQRVIENETIFTGPDSSVIVEFDDGTKFTLESESLVVIQRQEDKASIDIAQGGISGKLGKNVRLKTKDNKDFELSSEDGAEINLNLKDGASPKVDILSGKADFETNDGKQKIAQNQTVQFDKNKIANIQKHLIQLQSPRVNEYLIMSPKERIKFNWKPLQSADNYLFEFSSKKDFDGKYFSKATKEQTFSTPRPKRAGDYWWRVKLYKDGQLLSESLPRKLVVIHERVPEPVLPNNSSKLAYPYLADYLESPENAKFELNFKWLVQIDEKRTLFQIAKDEKFEKIIDELKQENTFTSLTLGPGNYYWRIKLNDKKSDLRTWSKPSQFLIYLERADLTPELISPINRVKLNMYDDSINLKFEWKEIDEVEEYFIEVSSSPEFTQETILVKDVISDNEFEWETELKQNFFWRVRAVTKDGILTKFSEVQEFKVKDPPPPKPPEIKTKKLEKEFSYRKKKEQKWDLLSFIIPSAHAEDDDGPDETKIKLEWEPVERAVKYRIEISPTKSFRRKVVDKEVKRSYFIWRYDQVGTYYWRVRGIDKKGIVGILSAPGTVTLRYNKPKPVPIGRFQHYLKPGDTTKTIPVKFEWNKGKYADSYQVQYANNKAFRNAKRVKTKENFIELRLPLNVKYFWRVRSLDRSGRIGSDYSEAKDVIAEPIITNLTPQLLSPLLNKRYRYTQLKKPAIKFFWDKVPYANSYEIEISRDPEFEEGVSRKEVKKNFYSEVMESPLRPAFYWRVRSKNAYSKSNWSDIRNFKIVSMEDLDTPEIIRPWSNVFASESSFDNVLFQWTRVDEALSYIIEIGVDPNFKFGKRIYLASNETATIRLKTRATYYYRIRPTYIYPKDENVSLLKKMPKLNVGLPGEIQSFNLNKGYNSELNFEFGLSNLSLTNTIATATGTQKPGAGASQGLHSAIHYAVWPERFGRKWGFAVGMERASAKLVMSDTDTPGRYESKIIKQDYRLHMSYRTSLSMKTVFQMDFGALRAGRSYPLIGALENAGKYFSNYGEINLFFKWHRKKNLYYQSGIKVITDIGDSGSTGFSPWWELRYYKTSSWYGLKLKYDSQVIDYGFDSSFNASDSLNFNTASVAFTAGYGF